MKKVIRTLLLGMVFSFLTVYSGILLSANKPWHLEANLLYSQPGDDLIYIGTELQTPDEFIFNNYHLEPGYKMGFDFSARYWFRPNHLSVELNWFHFNQTPSRTLTFKKSDLPEDFVEFFIKSISGRVSYNFDDDLESVTTHTRDIIRNDTIDMNVGPSITTGPFVKRWAFNVRYAHIRQDATNIFIPEGGNDFERTERHFAKLTGIGPGFIGKVLYDINSDISIKGQLGFNILYTQIQLYAIEKIGSTGTPVSRFNAEPMDKKNRVMPTVDADIRLQYHHSAFTTWVGFKLSHYFQAYDRAHFDIPTSGNLHPAVFINKGNSFNFQGPYAGIGYDF